MRMVAVFVCVGYRPVVLNRVRSGPLEGPAASDTKISWRQRLILKGSTNPRGAK